MTRHFIYACVLLTGMLAAVQASATEPGAEISWDALASAALYEPDDALRGEAIGEVGLYRHADAVAVLVEVATFDLEPDNRLRAVMSLWYSAADGLDGDGAIRAVLLAALDDPDERVAAKAQRAIEDLEALKAKQ